MRKKTIRIFYFPQSWAYMIACKIDGANVKNVNMCTDHGRWRYILQQTPPLYKCIAKWPQLDHRCIWVSAKIIHDYYQSSREMTEFQNNVKLPEHTWPPLTAAMKNQTCHIYVHIYHHFADSLSYFPTVFHPKCSSFTTL